MQLSHSRPKNKPHKHRLRTLCTLDTFDPSFAESIYRRGKENDQRVRNCPHLITQVRSTTNKKASMQHQQSQFSAYNYSRVKESSKKGKRAMSISQSSVNRIKTDYSQGQLTRTRPVAASLKKKLIFPIEETYKFDCWQVTKTIMETNQKEVLQVYQEPNKKEKCVMIKTKNKGIKCEYEDEMKVMNVVQRGMKVKEKAIFMKVRKIFKDKKQWTIVTDNAYHPNWNNDHFYMLTSTLKSSLPDLQLIVREVTKAIQILSRHGYVHSNIGIQSLQFPIQKGQLHIGPSVKLGGLRHSFRIDCKEAFLSLPTLFRTPPEILNFISFQCKEDFERDNLDMIGKLEAGWQIDVWGLGVLILEILNGGPLSGEACNRTQLISLQKQLPIRYSYLLTNMESHLQALLLQMVSIDPTKRPHPRQILRLL